MLESDYSPFPEIKTSRLLLRCIQLSDAPAILDLRSNDDAMKFIGREKHKTIQDAEALIQMIIDSVNANQDIAWAITLSGQPQKLIGTIGFWHFKREHYRAEIGYMLHPGYWRQGIMKEALAAAINYGFGPLQLHSIEAHINPENEASARLLESTGFTREAYFREDFFYRGRFHDTAVYSLMVK